MPDFTNIFAARRRIACCLLAFFILTITGFGKTPHADTTRFSTAQEALDFLQQQGELQPSTHWPHVNPVAFMENLRKNIEKPLSIYEGRSTNFCSYAALSYLPLHYDPLTYVRFMVKIYTTGKAVYGRELFLPTPGVRNAAGTLTFKGELDTRPADQLWFLTLADHFKGYLNIIDPHYNPGDENKLWAAVNFAKFNRMVRALFNYHVHAVGSDLIRPSISDIAGYLIDKLRTGTVAMFVNNLDLYKKNHTTLKLRVPTHYVILLGVEPAEDGKYAVTYWDYGFRSRQVLSPKFMKRIIFGISHITPKTADEQ